MSYFSRRNKHVIEFSGYEEVSLALRKRLLAIIKKYVGQNSFYDGTDPWSVETSNFYHEVEKEFPEEDPFVLVSNGEFHQVFTVVEIFMDMVREIYYTRRDSALLEIFQAFSLSGSVYTIQDSRVILKLDEDLAEKIENVKSTLSNNVSAYERFFNAVGGLVGRKAKPEDVVKDVFIATEDYLKGITEASNFGNAVSKLYKQNFIRREQKAILEKLHAFRSDSVGVGHAGSSPSPTEQEAMWFIESIISQLRYIATKMKHDQKT